MSKFRVKATANGVTKGFELDRSTYNFAQFSDKIRRLHGNSNNLRYQGSNGDIFIDNDQQLRNAVKDAERSRSSNFKVFVGSGGGSSSSSGSSASDSTQSRSGSHQEKAVAPRESPRHHDHQHDAHQHDAHHHDGHHDHHHDDHHSQSSGGANVVTNYRVSANQSTGSDKIKIEHSQGSDHFLFTPVASKYDTDVEVVLETGKLVFNSVYSLQEGGVVKTMTLTQTFNLGFTPERSNIEVSGKNIKLYF